MPVWHTTESSRNALYPFQLLAQGLAGMHQDWTVHSWHHQLLGAEWEEVQTPTSCHGSISPQPFMASARPFL